MLRASGPVQLRHVGKTEFVNGAAAMSASGIYGKRRHCADVGHADLTLGSRVEPVLEASQGGQRQRKGGLICRHGGALLSLGSCSAGLASGAGRPRIVW